jgi:hypothetical protein
VVCIADDITVMGEDDHHHDRQLETLLQACQQKGIKLNKSPDKLQLRAREMTLHGHVFTPDGIKPDPAKVKAIQDMPRPEDPSAVRRFCGTVQYLSRFLPHLAQVATPLRELTHKDVEWAWTTRHEEAFSAIKKMTCEAPLLAHYDPSAPLVHQTDASSYGLGAVLLQQEVPIAYVSRSMTATERRYAQIEKECLSVVFGLERFDQYTYGRVVCVENDHKPLSSLWKKPLRDIPKRLQAMMMRMGRYDVNLLYKPGTSMVLPDTLSRAPLPECPEAESFAVNMVAHLPISPEKIATIRDHTTKDPALQNLMHVIQRGWPLSKSDLPSGVEPYFSFRDELSLQDGIIFRGERVVIPRTLRDDIKRKLHTGHLGINSCLRRARELVFWPGISAEIHKFVESCDTCMSMPDKQAPEPPMMHEIPDRPWQKVGSDICELDGRKYLVTVDYYSKFFELDYLPDMCSDIVITKTKAHFARHGVPDIYVSDNGPQYTSAKFKSFANDWGFQHQTSAPGNSKANGVAEAAVKIAKRLMKKCKRSGDDPYLALINLRNTPTEGVGSSPVQRLFGRRTKGDLPMAQTLLEPSGDHMSTRTRMGPKGHRRQSL